MQKAALASILLLSGCWEMGKAGDAKIPGELLGNYQVNAQLSSSTCGEGAMGSPERWQFPVRLSRKEQDLYWLNGQEAIPGSVASDGVTFAFDSQVKVPVKAPERGRLGCVMWRRDNAAGTFLGQGTDILGMKGALKFEYAPDKGSDCTELIGVAQGFAVLPCEMNYDFEAVRTSKAGS